MPFEGAPDPGPFLLWLMIAGTVAQPWHSYPVQQAVGWRKWVGKHFTEGLFFMSRSVFNVVVGFAICSCVENAAAFAEFPARVLLLDAQYLVREIRNHATVC